MLEAINVLINYKEHHTLEEESINRENRYD